MSQNPQNNWLTCPICDIELKSKNFSKHIDKSHTDLPEKERKKVLAYKKKAKKLSNQQKIEVSSWKNTKSVPISRLNREKKGRLKKIFIAFGIVLIVFFVAYTSAEPAKSEDKDIELGTVCEVPFEIDTTTVKSWAKVSAPDFTSNDVLTGQNVALNQFKGSFILLNFVNYGCNPELNQIVSAQLLAVKEIWNQRNDFEPISVFCGCCPVETLKTFAESNDLNWTWLLDSDYSIIKLYTDYVSAYGYPTLIFIDGQGIIQDVTGYLDQAELTSKIIEYT